MPGSIVFAGIAPHPPLLIPEVGGARIKQVADSQRALTEFSRRLLGSNPDTVVLISPHSPLDPARLPPVRLKKSQVISVSFMLPR